MEFLVPCALTAAIAMVLSLRHKEHFSLVIIFIVKYLIKLDKSSNNIHSNITSVLKC